MLHRLRNKMHRFTRIWVTLFTLVWLTVVFPPCATAQPEAPAPAPAAMHEHHGHHGGMDHPAADAAADTGCLDQDCPVLSAVEKQAAPKPSVSDGDLHPALAVVAPLLRLPAVDAGDPARSSRLAAQTPLPAFPPALGFRVLLI
ncbi:MAG: hypothetical protein AB7U81_00060 [Thiohalomonadaceae bacterium]